MSLNHLSTILSSNKLENENYVDSKRNLDIILTVNKHKWVLTTPCPQTDDDSTQEEKDALAAWLRSDCEMLYLSINEQCVTITTS